MLYFLFVLFGWAIAGSVLNKLFFPWYDILLSGLLLLAVCLCSNYLLSKYLKIAKNNESDYISALILTLILTPTHSASGLIITPAGGLAPNLSHRLLLLAAF
jgi:uncharacterized membrane protein YjjP (DUF1212 family)